MKIVRHCRERLPGGARLWRSLAKQAGFHGTLKVIGYGVGNSEEAVGHRKHARKGSGAVTLAHITYADNKIVVFLPSPCSKLKERTTRENSPLFSYAHELGHWVHNANDTTNTERTADMYARRVLKGL